MQILAGEFKGRKLLAPRGRNVTRPMTGAAKKSLFGILDPMLLDAMVLDLFCGTGTLGIEAISHGAKHCCFADRDRNALSRLKRNIQTVGVELRSTIWGGDILRTLARRLRSLDSPVDIAFADPPYAQSRKWDWDLAERQFFTPLGQSLSRQGVVVLRVQERAEVPDEFETLVRRRVKRFGDMTIFLLQRREDST